MVQGMAKFTILMLELIHVPKLGTISQKQANKLTAIVKFLIFPSIHGFPIKCKCLEFTTTSMNLQPLRTLQLQACPQLPLLPKPWTSHDYT